MFRQRSKRKPHEIDPDEIFLDSSNLPSFDTHQFQGRMEKAISKNTLFFIGALCAIVMVLFAARLYLLQVENGFVYSALAENNRLQHTPLFPERGAIFDRNGTPLVWNKPFPLENKEFSRRVYTTTEGVAHILGFVAYPSQDASGFYINEQFQGKDGVERSYNESIGGTNGLVIVETDALGKTASQSTLRRVEDGKNLTLTIDVRVQEQMYSEIRSLARSVGFNAGVGVIMDVETGEIITLTSFPEYDPNFLVGGSEEVSTYVEDERNPFLNRAISGLYTPGSIVKPFIALAALSENVIDPETKILSTGSISVPHPYFKDKESIFTDWKAHGLVSLREALAVSSNVYFYEVGGGYQDQEGVGIERLEAYFRLLGFGAKTSIDLPAEEVGVIPTPQWKEKVFDEEWRIGDTYNTAIGQYGFQVTPIQAVRAVGVIANGGGLVTPHVVHKVGNKDVYYKKENIRYVHEEDYTVVREGMRMAVERGTGAGLNLPYVKIGAKTGTAEVGISKKRVNSWVVGFFPYEEPRYAFAVVMEEGPRDNLIGGLYVMRQLFDWMSIETPEYLNF